MKKKICAFIFVCAVLLLSGCAPSAPEFDPVDFSGFGTFLLTVLTGFLSLELSPGISLGLILCLVVLLVVGFFIIRKFA